MKIPPLYKITPEMLGLIAKTEANAIYLSSIKLPCSLKDKLHRTSILKSSLFSARIEGNRMNYEDINQSEDSSDDKKEIFNLLKAVNFIEHTVKPNSPLSMQTILNIHSKVMDGLSSESGMFRNEPSAIFNQAGIAIYIPPSPNQIKELIKQMLTFTNSKEKEFPLIIAFITHLIFEKIHPFIDGNGRVGRLLISAVLKEKQPDWQFFVPFEEYLDNNKQEYYYQLDNGFKNTNDYLLFMLKAFLKQQEEVKKTAKDEMSKGQSLLLTPRQEEILNIIKDQRIISFDQLKRRFLAIPSRTLGYDLKKLIDRGLVIKIGKTKGSYYSVVRDGFTTLRY